MRIDEIDLKGAFKLTGDSGSDSKALGMSGGSISWIDVVAGGGGSSAGLVQRSGYNYIIVEATVDSLTNGVKLKDAYIDVATLFNIGTPGIDNRFSILLTPGDYDFGDNRLNIDTSYIDIVGISQNPLDTIVRASGSEQTIRFDGSHDFGLYNIDLRSGGTGEQVAFYDYGSGSTYLRMKNVVISGNGFFDAFTNTFAFYDLDGEFEDITVLDGCNFALASNSLSGTYKNINISNTTYAFYAQSSSISGTYKNIKISNLIDSALACSSNISGIFEDININSNTNLTTIFTSSDLSGYFKNIIISGSNSSVFSGQITGIYEDIDISTSNNAFRSDSGDINGIFKNIKIGDATESSVFISSNGNVLGTYSNIEIGNSDNSIFSADISLSINIKDLKVGNIGGNAFYSNTGDLLGSYENINIGNVSNGSIFQSVSGYSILGTFKNIKVGSAGSCFISDNDLNGNYENIKFSDILLGNAFYAANFILGTYKKISVKSNVNDTFTSVDINGIFDDIYIGDSQLTFNSNGITGTFSNIEIVNTTNKSFSSIAISGYYDGITIGTSSSLIFENITSGTFKNIKVGSCTSFFIGGNVNPTLVENIEVGVASNNFIYGSDTLDGVYKNIKVGFVNGKSFFGSISISGTYSNIEVVLCSDSVFYSDYGNININANNMIINSQDIFNTPSGQITSNTRINKLNATSLRAFQYENRSKITNSKIITTETGGYISLSSGSIERCKIITNSGDNGIVGNGQVIYTLTNEPMNVAGLVSQNITDSDITS